MRGLMWRVGWAFTLVIVGCGIPEDQYNKDVGDLRERLAATENERDVCAQTLADLQGENEAAQVASVALSQRHASCMRELGALKSRGQELDQGLEQALKRIDELEDVAGRQRAVFSKLRRALDQLVKAGKLSVAIVRGQFTVQMADRILFDSAKYQVKSDARATIAELTRILADVPDRRYQVAGHTDDVGTDNFNWKLSGNRALAVAELMMENGMPSDRISFAGFGPYQPSAPNDSAENRSLNRRIEIVLIPDMEELLGPLTGDG